MPVPVPGPHLDVFPNSDADRASWAVNFGVAWVPATYNAVAPTALALPSLIAAYTAALAIADEPATRTSITIAAKDAAWLAFAAQARLGVRSAVAAYRAGLCSGADLLAIGVRVPDTTPTSIPAPIYAPLLGIDSVVLGSTRLRLTQVVDGAPVSTRKFPYGIRGVEISRRVGSGDWASVLQVRRVNIGVDTSSLAAGASIDYRARYISMRGEPGPWSEVVGAVVLG